jgi:ketosteroid isomerase-like protein
MKMTFFSALSAFCVFSVCATLAGNTASPLVSSADDAAAFQAFLRQFEEGTGQFINGDATRWKQHVSLRDDATIMGGFGGYERGKEVGPRYDWAAAQFRPSGAVLKVEHLSSGVSGDLAYTVTIERSQVLVAGQTAPMPMALRVSHVFRKEGGAWKLLHRHADHLVEKAPPGNVLRK